MTWTHPRFSSSPATAVVPVVLTATSSNNHLIPSFRKRNASSRTRILSLNCRASEKASEKEVAVDAASSTGIDCIATGLEVECVVSINGDAFSEKEPVKKTFGEAAVELGLLISPFFLWGTSMVAMKGVLPKVGPFFVSSFRLIPAGLLLVGFAVSRGRKMPSGFNAWLSIIAFGLVDASFFQGFLAEGLERTTAGLGSVIIDSQPLSVAILASLFFGESIGYIGVIGLVVGVIGLLLLEAPALAFDATQISLWENGELWMLLAAQSMAIGTVMVRWVSKYSDPVMATGWHMVIGGIPLLAISFLNNDPGFSSLEMLTTSDSLSLLYTSIFGSAISYGVFFYNATRGSLTKLSSLTFLTPMFALLFGYLCLGETFTPLQFVGVVITFAAIYMVNYKNDAD